MFIFNLQSLVGQKVQKNEVSQYENYVMYTIHVTKRYF